MSTGTSNSDWVVVINDEGQYSVWPAERTVPDGWRAAGPRGDREACLDWIEGVWTDLVPLSVRKVLQALRVRG